MNHGLRRIRGRKARPWHWFDHPEMQARIARAEDDLANGRYTDTPASEYLRAKGDRMTAAARLFCPPVIPEPPSKYAEARLEWSEGYKAGWAVGPGREAPSLYDKAAPVRKKQWGATALGGLRGAAWKAGKEAARDAKRAIIAELWPIAQERGRPHTHIINNWPRSGIAYQGVLFYFFGTGKMPIVEPVNDTP